MGQWSETRLWKSLSSWSTEANRSIILTLENCLPDIETILRSSGTSSYQFTLHDDQHAFRVSERMIDLLPSEFLEQSSEIELALLLLAAYLHDIGMTPNRELTRRHWQYLITGDQRLLDPSEQRELQHWLDTEWKGLEPPIADNTLTTSGIPLLEHVFAFYCRHKHNDWNELWIRQNLLDAKHGLYAGWTEDLIVLCRSHHENLPELRQSRFDARVVGNPGYALNLRYLAAILRLADVLEFDPERTPPVILEHRAIPVENRIYSTKDQAIRLRRIVRIIDF